MKKNKCIIYDSRPDICSQFPAHAGHIKNMPSCGYYFDAGVRKGRCNGCGECCVDMPWNDNDELEFGNPNLVSDVICRFIK